MVAFVCLCVCVCQSTVLPGRSIFINERTAGGSSVCAPADQHFPTVSEVDVLGYTSHLYSTTLDLHSFAHTTRQNYFRRKKKQHKKTVARTKQTWKKAAHHSFGSRRAPFRMMYATTSNRNASGFETSPTTISSVFPNTTTSLNDGITSGH